jgi:membrane protease YdiL (CAAX protease family)
VFYNAREIRPGWRILVCATLFFTLLTLFSWTATFLHSRSWPKFGRIAAGEVELLLAVLLATGVMARLERRTFACYGLQQGHLSLRQLAAGTVCGLLAISAVIFTLYGLHSFSFGPLALRSLWSLLQWALLHAGLFLIVGLAEEFLLRGYVQFALAQAIGFWPAAAALSLTFGALHLRNSGEGLAGAAIATLFGLLFALTLRQTGALWFAIGMHASWDWGQSFLYSVPNSGIILPGHLFGSRLEGPVWLTGGTTGPEASVVTLLLLGGLWSLANSGIARPSTKPDRPASGSSVDLADNPPSDLFSCNIALGRAIFAQRIEKVKLARTGGPCPSAPLLGRGYLSLLREIAEEYSPPHANHLADLIGSLAGIFIEHFCGSQFHDIGSWPSSRFSSRLCRCPTGRRALGAELAFHLMSRVHTQAFA